MYCIWTWPETRAFITRTVVETTEYRTHVQSIPMYHLLCKALVLVIYSVVSGQYSYTIIVCNSCRSEVLSKSTDIPFYYSTLAFHLPKSNNKAIRAAKYTHNELTRMWHYLAFKCILITWMVVRINALAFPQKILSIVTLVSCNRHVRNTHTTLYKLIHGWHLTEL